MADDPKFGSVDTEGLDSTIDQLELLLESKRELLRETSAGQRPPSGVKIPRLTDKIVTVANLKFSAAESKFDAQSEADSNSIDPQPDMAALIDDVKRAVGENMQQAFAELKADVVA